ncbi:hypothetical protein ABT024_05375 [Streptomyces sp. NPDC002812]|uniref:hypothetical protein n=1 Tax=Streptomyces sp. NPDC002812 TaxID=3154434 RepID=UPI003322AAE6
MANFLDTQADSRRMARLLDDYDRRLQALERSTQASYTSIEGGSIEVYDNEGNSRGSIGVQPDGTVAIVPANSPPPPTPTIPIVEPVLAGLVITWDGMWDDKDRALADFALVQVHLGPAADFTPTGATLAGAVADVHGGSLTVAVAGYTAVWVRLVAVNTAALPGPPSAAVQGTPRQAVPQDLIDGIITETKLAQSAVTEAKIALGAVSSGALAAGAVLEDKLGKAAVTLDKIGRGAVTLNALGGALADGVTQRYVDAMSDPAAWRVLSQAAGSQWQHVSGVADAPTGQSVARATGYTVVRGAVQVPYEPDVLYRVSARVRTTSASVSGNDLLYVGVLGIAADGISMVSRTGANAYTQAHYVAAAATPQPVDGGWVTYIGYLRGRAAPDQPGTGGQALDPRTPGVLHSAVRFVSPILYLNYGSGAAGLSGVMEVDAFTIEVLKTGIVDSSNLVVGSVTTAALATDAVTAGKIAASSIGAREITAGSITAIELAAGSVTTSRILAGAITTDKLTALAVTAEKISALAVTTDKLAALSVTADKLAVNSITASKIEAGAIDAGHIKAGSITADHLSLGTDGNVVADPGFEGPVTDLRLAGQTYWTAVTPGNGSPRAIRVSATAATATTRTHTLALAPAAPGQRMYLAVDYLASADWAGERVSIYVRWEDSGGSPLGFSVVSTDSSTTVKGSWQRLQGVADTAAPPDTVRARVTISSFDATSGTVTYDNAVARQVIGADHSGGRAELTPLGLTLYNGDGEESVALTTGRPNYLTFTSSGQAVATIDQRGDAGFGNLSVAGKLTVAGDPIDELISHVARGLVAVDYQTTTVTTNTADFGFVELAFTADKTRMYRIVLDAYAAPSAAGGELVLVLRDGGAASPSITSPMIQSAVHPLPTTARRRVRLETIRPGAAFGAGLHRLLTSFYCQSGPSGQTVELGGASGRPGVFYIEDVGPYIRPTGQYNTGGGASTLPALRHTTVYDAAWSGSYASRSSYNAHYGNQMMFGYSSATYGLQASLVGFSSQLATDLAGAVIERAEVFLYFDHWYSNSGGTAVIKAHNHSSRPTTFSCDSEVQSVSWARNEGKWVDITAVFDSTSWRGIALDPTSTSSTYYGSARGVGETYPPQLRVTYTK